MRKLLVLAAAVGTAAVISAACGGNVTTGGGGTPTPPLALSSGSYTAGAYQPGTDTCHLDYDPTGGSYDGFASAGKFVSAIGVQALGSSVPAAFFDVSASAHTLTAPDQLSVLHFQPIHYIGGGGINCTVQQTFKATGTITTADVAMVTVETDLAKVGGTGCSQISAYTLPCSSVETFELRKNGPTNNPTAPTPTPVPSAVTATLSASSDVSSLVDYYNTTNGQGALAGFSTTINGTTITNPGHSWWCYGPDFGNVHGMNQVFAYGALAEGTAASFYLTVSTGSWSVGSKTVDGSSVYVELITLDSNQNPAYDLIGQSGTVTLSSAGRLVDAPGSHCKYSLSNVAVSGYKLEPLAPTQPRLARDLQALARKQGLKVYASPGR